MPLEIPDWVINEEVNRRLEEELDSSTCTKRAIAAVLWSHEGYFVSGHNGPPDCFKDHCIPCPRADSPSGEDMHLCPAIHGELAAILNAAKKGTETKDGALFISCALPCKDCMKEIIGAGIKYIISPYEVDFVGHLNAKHYNFSLSRQMMEQCGVEYIHDKRMLKGR